MARGALIDEPALIRALETGKIAGAGLDTVTQEPLDPANEQLSAEEQAEIENMRQAAEQREDTERAENCCAELRRML